MIVQIYPLIFTQSILIFGKVLMCSEIGLDIIALLSFGKFKKVKADIARLKQTTEFVEIPPEKSII